MRKIITSLVLAASITFGGCATFGEFGAKVAQDISNIAGIISGVTVTPQAVVIAANSVDALQDTATAYLRLPLCRAGGTPVCRARAATQPIKRAVLAMRSARNDLESFLAAHPGTAPPASLYDKVTAAVNALGDIIAQYRAAPVIAVIAK